MAEIAATSDSLRMGVFRSRLFRRETDELKYMLTVCHECKAINTRNELPEHQRPELLAANTVAQFTRFAD